MQTTHFFNFFAPLAAQLRTGGTAVLLLVLLERRTTKKQPFLRTSTARTKQGGCSAHQGRKAYFVRGWLLRHARPFLCFFPLPSDEARVLLRTARTRDTARGSSAPPKKHSIRNPPPAGAKNQLL